MNENNTELSASSGAAATSPSNALPPTIFANALTLRQLAQHTRLSEPAIERAREIAGLAPSSRDWQSALVRIGAIGAAACASAALVCFIAYNWDALGRWFRFALFEAALVMGVLLAVLFTHKPLVHRAASLFALFALGGLLAFTGQTYQTGADTYQLFVAWAMLGLPWFFAARWWGYTLVWFIIVQVGLAVWSGHISWVRFTWHASAVYIGIIAVNVVFALGFYSLRHREGFDQRWLWRFAVFATLGWAITCAFVGGELLRLDTAARAFAYTRFDLIAACVIATTFSFCSRAARDSFDATILYVAWFCGLVLITRWLVVGVEHMSEHDGSLFLLIAALFAGGAAYGTFWIRELSKNHETQMSAADTSSAVGVSQ